MSCWYILCVAQQLCQLKEGLVEPGTRVWFFISHLLFEYIGKVWKEQ